MDSSFYYKVSGKNMRRTEVLNKKWPPVELHRISSVTNSISGLCDRFKEKGTPPEVNPKSQYHFVISVFDILITPKLLCVSIKRSSDLLDVYFLRRSRLSLAVPKVVNVENVASV